jgi:DNA-directed RNA polymerase specialized sigma subunit
MLAHVVPTDEAFLEEIEDSEDFISQVETSIDMEILLKKLISIVNTKLSPREREVVSYLYGLGDFPKLRPFEIASKLSISRGTVAYYIKRAFVKLNDAFIKDIPYYEAII